MINIVWFVMIAFGFIYGWATGNIGEVTEALTSSAETGVTIALGLIGVMALWLGLMKIAEESGLVAKVANVLRPITVKLFPEVAESNESIGAMIMTFAVDLVGSPNAGTPIGLLAMNELQKINPHKEVASDSMVTFIAIVCSSLTIVPVTIIAMLSAADGTDTTNIIGPVLIATTVSTVTAVVASKLLGRLRKFKVENRPLVNNQLEGDED